MQQIKQHFGSWSDLIAEHDNNPILHYSFDFWNTIVISNPLFKRKRAEYLLNILNQDLTINEVNLAFEKVGKDYNRIVEEGSIILKPVELYKKVLEELNCVIPQKLDHLVNEIDQIFLQYPPSISSGFNDYLEIIIGSKKSISITSNTAFISGSTIKSYLNSIGLAVKFNFFLFSDEVGFAKPTTYIFKKLLSNIREYNPYISKNEIIHIGDNILTDYLGAIKFGIKAFRICSPYVAIFPRYSVHSITSKDNLPLSAEEYSKFKFGDYSIAKKYGSELFDYFISKHLSWLQENNDPVIIYSSPYSQIPTSSYHLSSYFFKLLDNYLKNTSFSNVEIKWGKINRCQTYTEDYGALNADQRYDLIKNDTYLFDKIPEKGHRLIFIDDISITGTHQRVIENLLKLDNIKNESIFLYYSTLDNINIDATFENELNYNYVNSIKVLLNIILSGSFKITTRAVKYILKSPESEFENFITSLISNNKIDVIEKIYTSSLSNQYNKIDIFNKNHSILKTYLNKLTKPQKPDYARIN